MTVAKGSYSITYYKTNQNGIDLLTKVEDSAGRITTYDFSIKDAKYNMHGSTSNPKIWSDQEIDDPYSPKRMIISRIVDILF